MQILINGIPYVPYCGELGQTSPSTAVPSGNVVDVQEGPAGGQTAKGQTPLTCSLTINGVAYHPALQATPRALLTQPEGQTQAKTAPAPSLPADTTQNPERAQPAFHLFMKTTKEKGRTMKEKLTSRKFWVAVAATITGIVVLIKPGTDTSQITGLVLTLGSVITYIAGEGFLDAKASKPQEDSPLSGS